jgi:hypothetical protein
MAIYRVHCEFPSHAEQPKPLYETGSNGDQFHPNSAPASSLPSVIPDCVLVIAHPGLCLVIPDCVWSSRTVFGHPGLRSGIQCIHQSLRGGLKTGPRVKPGVTVIGARVTVICHPALGLRHPGLRSGIQSPFCHPGLRSGIQCIHQLLRNSSKTGPRVKPGVTVTSHPALDAGSSLPLDSSISPISIQIVFFESKN